jgi:hypothetical protein
MKTRPAAAQLFPVDTKTDEETERQNDANFTLTHFFEHAV